MATSREEIPREDREAAETLIKLSQDTRYLPIEEEDAAPSSTLLLQEVSKAPQKSRPCNNISKTKGKRKKLEVDDTDETLMIIQEWDQTKPDPMEKIFKDDADVAELFSEPIKKQLTVSDVDIGQGRLMLGKQQVQKKMLPLLKDYEIPKGNNGLDVSVYGPNKVVQTMKFKMWIGDTPVLTTGWNKFVVKCDLKEHCDFLSIWMFRDRKTRGICFAIDKTRFPTITGPLSLRISNSVFPNPN